MHDSMVVAHEIHIPIPTRKKWRERAGEPRWALGRRRYTGPELAGKPIYRPWRPGAWEPVIAGRRYQLRTVATVWHVEPDGRDSGEVCRHHVRREDWPSRWTIRVNPFLRLHSGSDDHPPWLANRAWKWHVHHWHVQVHLAQRLRRFLLERCEECGHRYPWGYAPVSHQWDSPRTRWRDGVQKRAYHHQCSSLVMMRRTQVQDEELIRALFAAYRVERDESEEESLERLTDPRTRAWEFHMARRLTTLVGFERDDKYKLVRKVSADA